MFWRQCKYKCLNEQSCHAPENIQIQYTDISQYIIHDIPGAQYALGWGWLEDLQ